jgi:hypothetical protein
MDYDLSSLGTAAPEKTPTVAQQKPSYTMTPGAEEIQSDNYAPPPPEDVPPWNEVTATDEYKNANANDKLHILDGYVKDSRAVANSTAAQNKEDPGEYQHGIDQFEAAERAKLDSNPLDFISNTAKAGLHGALSETAKIATGGALAAKDIVQPEQDLSGIKDLSIDDAKYQRDKLQESQPDYEKSKEEALNYLQDPKVRMRQLQDPEKYPPLPGGSTAALDTVRLANANDNRLKALNDYVGSNGKIVPQQTDTEAAAASVREIPGIADNAHKVDEIYLRQHPKLNGAVDAIGRVVPFIAGMTAGTAALGPEGAAVVEGTINYADAFQNGYESAQAKLDERERGDPAKPDAPPEHFTPEQREQLALNDASRSAFGVGSWQTVSNFILGTALDGMHLPPGTKMLSQENLKHFLLSSGAEVGGQIGIQSMAQIAGNQAAIKSGVSPDQSLYAGVPQAAATGAIFGGAGAIIRAGRSAIDLWQDDRKIGSMSDAVRVNSDKLFQSGVDPDMTRESAFESVLNETVPEEYRPLVKAKVLKDAAAQDLNQTAQNLATTSPQSAEAQSQVADTVKNSPVVKVGSKADQLKAQMDAKDKAEEEAKQAKIDAKAAKTGKKPGAPPPPTTEVPPTEGGVTPPTEEPKPGEPPAAETAPEPEDPAKIAQRNDDIQSKLKTLLGGNPTAKQLQNLGYDYLRNNVYPNKDLSNPGGHRLMHELGVLPTANPGKNWGKVPPEMMGQLGDNFNNFLSDKIAQKQVPGAPGEPGKPAPPSAVEEPTETERTWVIPPEVMADAVAKNDPAQLIEQLQQGKELVLSPEQTEDPKVDDFLYEHKFNTEFDKDNNSILKLPEDYDYHPLALEFGVAGKGPKGKGGETRDVEISPNSNKFIEETNALPAHPHEDALLETAAKQIYGLKGESWVRQAQKDPALRGDIQSAAIQIYRRDLRRYAQDMTAGGFKIKPPEAEGEEESAEPKDMTAGGFKIKPPEAEGEEEEESAEPKELTNQETSALDQAMAGEKAGEAPKTEKDIRPPTDPFAALNYASRKMGQKLATSKIYNQSLITMDKPLGEGIQTLHEQLGTTPSEEALSEKRPEVKIGKGEDFVKALSEARKQEDLKGVAYTQEYKSQVDGTSALQDTGSQDFHNTVVNNYLPQISEREQRELWYYLDKKFGNVILPEGVKGKSASGITQSQANRAGFRFADWLRENINARRGTEEIAPGHEPEHLGPGKPGVSAAVGQPGRPPAAHEVAVPVHGLPGAKPNEPAPENVQPAGAVKEQGGELLPTHPGPGEGETPPGTGGERTTSTLRPGSEPAVSSERVAILRDKPPETAQGGRRPSTADSPGTEPGRNAAGGDVTGTGINLDQIAQAFLKNEDVAGEYDFDVEDANLQDVKDHLEELAEQEDPENQEAFYREIADNLSLKPEKAADEKATQAAAETISTSPRAEETPGAVKPPPSPAETGGLVETGAQPEPWLNVPESPTPGEGDHAIKYSHNDHVYSGKSFNEAREKGIAAGERILPDTSIASGFIKDGKFERGEADEQGQVQPAKPAAPKPAPAKPAPELITAKGKNQEGKTFSLIRQIAKTLLGNPEFADKYGGLDLHETFGGEPFDPNKAGDVTHLSDHISTSLELLSPEQKLGRLQRLADNLNNDLTLKHGTPETDVPPTPAAPPLVGVAAQNQDISEKIFNHFLKNPNDAISLGLGSITDPQHIIDTLKSQFATQTPTDETLNRMLSRVAQHLGVIDPPKPPGGTESGGVMHSLVPGIAGVHHFSGLINDLVGRFRNSPDPDMQAFAISLNANRDTLQGMVVRQLNNATPAIFYHDGELWVSPSAVRHANGEQALAHEIQHTIAQQKIAFPQTAEEHDLAAHWNDIHSELRKSLPGELRNAAPDLAPIFDDYEANQELDTRFLSRDEKNWLPILYAAQKGDNMMQAVFSNPAFRDYLHSVPTADGRTILERVQHWGNTVFGKQAFKYADQASAIVGKHPGVLTRFNPKVFDLRGAYPLTESERQVQATVRKYGLRGEAADSLRKVADVSNNPRHIAIARAMASALDKYPEIKIGLENRLGGFAGGYDFQGDRITVNPHYDDDSVEGSIIHEAIHGLTIGKISAYEKGMTHLLSAADCQSINELEQIRDTALKSKGVPDVIRRIAGLETYQQREKALVQLLQRDPSMNKWYGLTSTEEFASEVMSNGELQDHLARIPYREGGQGKPQSMLQRMFGWVKKFLGFEGDTAISKAFDSVVTLMGGRRVMENDIQTGGLDSEKSMVARENLLAKRHLDQRAQAEGYPDTRSVDPDTLNQWLSQYRDGKGLAQRDDPYNPRAVAEPRTSAMSPSSGKLSAMTDPRDIIDHLAKLNNVPNRDTDSLRLIADRALKDRSLSVDQYLHTQGALNELEGQVYNRILVPSVGNKNDRESVISKMIQRLHSLRPRGELPVDAYEALRKHLTYAKQETAFEIRNRLEAYDKAVAREFKGGKPTADQIQDMNSLLEGGSAPRTYSANLINALGGMRDMIDERSYTIRDEEMVSKKKKATIKANMGLYVGRNYRLFDDARFLERPESTQHQAAAEAAVNKMLIGKNKDTEARRIARYARDEAARAFTPGTTAYNEARKNAYDTAYAGAMKNIGPHFLNRKTQEWLQTTVNRDSKGNFRYGHAFSINDKLMTELTNLPPAVRALIGEERDPGARFAKTVWRQQNFINTNRVASDLLSLGRKGGYIGDDMSPTLNRQIPEGFYHLGALKGKYTTPEVADSLTAMHEQMEGFEDGPMGKFFRSFESRARYFSTIFSLQRSMANLHGAFFSHLNNGYWNPNQPRAWKDAGDVFWGQLLRQSNPEREALLMKLNRLGLSDKESNINHVMDYLKSGDHILERTPQDFMEGYEKWYTKGKEKLGVNWLAEHGTDLHTVWNFMSKASQFAQQLERERTFNNWDVQNRGASQLTESQLEDRAAQTVRETNISYSRISPMMNKWRRNPVLGTFLTYAEQAIQSYVMSWVHALKNLRSDNPFRRKDGLYRMGGVLTSILVPWGLQAASQRMNGVSDEEDKNFRSLLSPWEQNNAIFYGSYDPQTKRRFYWDTTYSSSQGDIGRSIHALFAPNHDGIIGKARDSAYELFHSALNLGLIPGALVDLSRNQTEYGTQVYNPSDTWLNNGGDITQYLLKREFGGTIGRAVNKGGLALRGQEVSPGGAVYNLSTALAPELTGARIEGLSFPERFRSELYSSKDSIDHVQQIFNAPIQRSGNELTDDQIESLYQRMDDARKVVFSNLHDKVNAARFGGMSTTAIKTSLKARRYSTQEIDDIMTGRYRAYKPSAAVLDNAKKNGNHVPPHLFSRNVYRYDQDEAPQEESE